GARAEGPRGVARYAGGEDYHAIMEPRLGALAATVDTLVPGSASRAYVATGPLLERDLAARAGLGWIGKNTMLLHPDLGSFFFIGTVLTTAEIEVDTPLPDRCGTCTRCLDACPTGAFVRSYVLDARRCISYLTIEHRGPIPAELREGVGGGAFGCDVCQDVCPWNRHAPRAAGRRRGGLGPRPASAARRAPGPGRGGLPGGSPRQPAQARASRGASPQRRDRARQSGHDRGRAGAGRRARALRVDGPWSRG